MAMTTQEVMNYLEGTLRPQLSVLTEAINSAVNSSNTIINNSNNALRILKSALSSEAGDVALEDGTVLPNIKKAIKEIETLSAQVQSASDEALAKIRTQSAALLAEMATQAQIINDGLENGATNTTFSSQKILSLLNGLKSLESEARSALKSEMESKLAEAKSEITGKLEEEKSAREEANNALKSEVVGKIEAERAQSLAMIYFMKG